MLERRVGRKRRLGLSAVGVSLVAVVGATVIGTLAATPIASVVEAGPVDFPSTTQMITVTVQSRSDTTGTLTALEKVDGSWRPVVGPVTAFVGSEGIGSPRDDVPRTPEGTFALDQAFGRQANPGTKMPYFRADTQDWWDELPSSPTYNTHVRSATSPGGDSENLYSSGPVYDYAVNIAHNSQRRPGFASGIFLHVANGSPTQGCVSTDRASLVSILKWLDPARDPVIRIGVASERA